jgi:hypothetical protein
MNSLVLPLSMESHIWIFWEYPQHHMFYSIDPRSTIAYIFPIVKSENLVISPMVINSETLVLCTRPAPGALWEKNRVAGHTCHITLQFGMC